MVNDTMINMVKRVLILACLVFAHPLLAAPRGWVEVKPTVEQNGSQSQVRGEVRDAAGHRYAIKNQGRSGIVKWDGTTWQTLPLNDGEWRPELLAPFGKGILSVWSKSISEPSDGESYRLNVYEGGKSRWLVHPPLKAFFFQYSLTSSQLFPSGTSQLLLINGRDLYHIMPNGKVVPLFKLTRASMQRLGATRDFNEQINALKALDDKHGGYWFWSNVWEHGEGAYSLRGLLHWDGHKLIYLPSLPGLSLTSGAIDALSLRDEKSLWLALGKNGLFVLDRATLQTRRVTEPAPKAFYYVQQVTPQNGELFVMAYTRSYDADADVDDRMGQLWRLKNGRWQRVIDGVDKWEGDENPRPILSNAAGVWFPSAQGGLWLAPPHGAPALLNWRYGLPVRTISKLETQKDGSTLIEGWGGRYFAARIVSVPALLAQCPTPRIQAFKAYLSLEQDRGGRIWALLNLRGKALSEWNGSGWVHHPVPGGYKLSNANAMAFDRLNRIWLHSDYRDGQVAIFNCSVPGPTAWKVYPNYQTALVAQLGAKTPALPQFRAASRGGDAVPSQTPDYHNGQLCYLDALDQVHYFDGKKWRLWKIKQISPQANLADDFQVQFSGKGILNVWISGDTWQLTPQGWRKKAESGEATRYSSIVSTSASVPRGLFNEQNGSASAVRDPDGYYYVVAQRQLFRMTPDKQSPRLIAPLFQPDENQPFADGSSIQEAYFDHAGNVFFDLDNNDMVLLPAPRPPDTRAALHMVSMDGFDISCSTTANGPHWFVWRRADRPWSSPQTSPNMELREFPGGTSRVEVAVIDRYLHRDPTPAVLTIKVNIDPQAQIAGFIADLASPDYAQREKAVAALAKQPDRSLPALRAARVKASSDLQWWIDAAVQAAEAE